MQRDVKGHHEEIVDREGDNDGEEKKTQPGAAQAPWPAPNASQEHVCQSCIPSGTVGRGERTSDARWRQETSFWWSREVQGKRRSLIIEPKNQPQSGTARGLAFI